MRKMYAFFSAVGVLLLVFASLDLSTAHAFNKNSLMNDAVFSHSTSMSATAIDNWLNANFPSSCISTNNGFSSPDPTGYSHSTGYTYGANVSAGRVIADSALAYGINPQVLIATLQKESSVVSGTASYHCQYINTAMGYGCPDSGSCPTNPATMSGFSKQVIHAAWLLRFGQQRSLGNTAWNVQYTNFPQPGDRWDNSDDPPTTYGGPMTQGYRARVYGGTVVYYDGYTTIDNTSVHMDTGATAALYWYTPHFSGNQHFDDIFTSWFGDPNSTCVASSNVSGAPSGRKIIAYQYSRSTPTSLAFTQMNNTGSACVEVHLWSPGYRSWAAHLATGMRATNPANGTLVANNAAGNFVNSLLNLTYITYSGANGKAENHIFPPGLQTFPGYYDVATNLGGVSTAKGMFVVGDFFGRHFDQLSYVLYNGSTGHAEVHVFDTSLQKAIGYYDVATNISGVSASSGTFVAGDFLGRGYDQMLYVLYNGSTGHAEIHMFDPTLRKAIGFYDVATDLTGVSSSTGTFVAGDFLGRGYDQLAYVMYNGGSGRVEVHTFTPDLRKAIGFQDIATNLPGFNPAQ